MSITKHLRAVRRWAVRLFKYTAGERREIRRIEREGRARLQNPEARARIAASASEALRGKFEKKTPKNEK